MEDTLNHFSANFMTPYFISDQLTQSSVESQTVEIMELFLEDSTEIDSI